MSNPVDELSSSLKLAYQLSAKQRFDLLINRVGLPDMPCLSGDLGGNVLGSAMVCGGALGDKVNQLNEIMRQYGLRFELSEFDSRVITQVVDRQSGEVIRQIPAEEMLRIAEAFANNQGRLVEASA